MSESEGTRAEADERRALSGLEAAVGELLREMESLRLRARRAETRVRDVESLLRRFTTGEEDPVQLRERVAQLDQENRDLRQRVNEGREGVERLLARIRFLEEAQ